MNTDENSFSGERGPKHVLPRETRRGKNDHVEWRLVITLETMIGCVIGAVMLYMGCCSSHSHLAASLPRAAPQRSRSRILTRFLGHTTGHCTAAASLMRFPAPGGECLMGSLACTAERNHKGEARDHWIMDSWPTSRAAALERERIGFRDLPLSFSCKTSNEL